jgi:hypothetical protein
MANMVVHTTTGELPRSSDVAEFYHCAPLANEEHGPSTTTALANLATANGVDHCSISRIVAIRNCCFLLDYFKEVR